MFIFQSEKPSSGPIYWWNKINKIHNVVFFGSVSFNIFNLYLQHFSTKVQWFNPISHPKNRKGPHLAWASASLGSRWFCRGANFREQLTGPDVFFLGKLQQFICVLWTKHGNILLKFLWNLVHKWCFFTKLDEFKWLFRGGFLQWDNFWGAIYFQRNLAPRRLGNPILQKHIDRETWPRPARTCTGPWECHEASWAARSGDFFWVNPIGLCWEMGFVWK